MKHFKDFLLKLQTLDIKVNGRKQVSSSQQREVNYYDIHHENSFLSSSFKKELRELKELALTDLLTIPVAQAYLQLERLKGVEDLFHTFWDRYYHLNVPTGSEHNLELVLRLNLDDLFIAPGLVFSDHAIADDNFINDLESTIRYREEILKDLKTAVLKIVETKKERTDIPVTNSFKKELKAKPSFREDIIPTFLTF